MNFVGGWTPLPSRGVIAITGPDARKLLQGLLTADVDSLSPDTALYSALLSPQGKILFDFFLAENDGCILLDCEGRRTDDLVKRFTMYRLRADAEIENACDRYAVWAFTGSGDAGPRLKSIGGHGGVMFADPRLARMGHRAILPQGTVPDQTGGGEEDYRRYRIALGLPEGAAEMGDGTTFALEGNLDVLNGLSFTKGCFIGQELAARMHHRSAVKKRLLPVEIKGVAEPGDAIYSGERAVGDIRSVAGGRGIARLRLDQAAGPLSAQGGARIAVDWPDWLPR